LGLASPGELLSSGFEGLEEKRWIMGKRVALLFPGQGSQYVGMGRELLAEFPLARMAFEEASDALGEDLMELCLEGPEEKLTLTANAQPAILTLSVAILRVVRQELDLEEVCAAGHSLGEYSALVAAGSLDLPSAVVAVRKRGEFMQEAVPAGQGSMAAILGLEAGEVDSLCQEMAGEEVVVAANYNGPGQVVISGHKSAVERVCQAARGRGAKKVVPLQVSAPFHSPLLAPAGEKLRKVLESIPFRDPAFPVISNVDAAPYPSKDSMVKILARQVSSPVRWEESMQVLSSMGVDMAVELGPKKVLVGLLKRIVPGLAAFQVEDKAGLRALEAVLG